MFMEVENISFIRRLLELTTGYKIGKTYYVCEQNQYMAWIVKEIKISSFLISDNNIMVNFVYDLSYLSKNLRQATIKCGKLNRSTYGS
jgi:hypothetical protein